MVKQSALETFNTKFWKYYKEKKYSQIVNDIPQLMKFECTPANVYIHQKLCVFSIITMVASKTGDDTHITAICNKYQSVIANSERIEALQYFISLEYVCEWHGTPETVYSHLIGNVAPAVLNRLTTWKHSWSNTDLTSLNRFIIVLVELESHLSSSSEWTVKFTSAQEAINIFSTVTTDNRKTDYAEYLLSMLNVLLAYREEKADSVYKLVKKFGALVKTKSVILKDIAIMMSQIIRASTLLISKGSILFKEQILTLLSDLYDIIRSKSFLSSHYTLHKTHDAVCCEKPVTHAGLQIMGTVRTIFVDAVKGDQFNSVIVSVMSNFAMAETKIISDIDCSNRERFKRNVWQTMRIVTENIEKIVTTCGLDRAKRTLQKFLAIESLEPSQYINIISALLKICKNADNKIEQIGWGAMKLMFCTEERNRIAYMFGIHELQQELVDPKQFESISSIVKSLPKKDYPLRLTPVQLQLLQTTVEIDYPRLPAMCLQKLVDDMLEMDFYKNDHSCYANLCKSGVCYLQCLAHIKQHKSNVQYENAFEPMNEKFMSLKKEVEIVEKLKEALDYLAKFIRDKNAWKSKSDVAGYISFTEKLLQQIGETLMNRHYKDVAVIAFDLLHTFSKLFDHPHQQMISAGYLIENIQLASTISEKEIVTELQSFLMQKLRDVSTMSVDELGSFLFSFLQLTMYTMRHQRNIEHAKKYMQAINKLLHKYDPDKAKYLAVRLKYAEVMFELIVNNPDTTITPVTFIEDIFHRFKSISLLTRSDYQTIPGIVTDLLITLFEFTQPRYELKSTSSLNMTVHCASVRNGYLFLLAKTATLTSTENILINEKRFEDRIKQLDVLFDCPRPAVQTGTEGETATWNRDITSLIHPANCKCFQCKNKFLNTLTMDVATVKASAVYFKKDYEKSLDSFKRIYNHWTGLTALSYSGMLMHYSNCLISNNREDKSNAILNEALDVCNDYAQAQDISVRLLFNAEKNELKIKEPLRPYADEVRPKAVPTIQVQSEKKVTRKPKVPAATVTTDRKTYPKRSNIRN